MPKRVRARVAAATRPSMRPLTLAVLVSTVLAACDLISEPEGPVLVTISGPASAEGERTTNDEGEAIVQCQVQLEASADGGGTWDAAIWSAATVTWTDLDTGEVQQEATWDASEVADRWGLPRLSDGQARTTSWLFWSYAAFEVTADFFYTDSSTGDNRSASYSLRCE